MEGREGGRKGEKERREEGREGREGRKGEKGGGRKEDTEAKKEENVHRGALRGTILIWTHHIHKSLSCYIVSSKYIRF